MLAAPKKRRLIKNGGASAGAQPSSSASGLRLGEGAAAAPPASATTVELVLASSAVRPLSEEELNYFLIAEAKPSRDRYADDRSGEAEYRKDYKAWHKREQKRKERLQKYEAANGPLIDLDDTENVAQGIRRAEQMFEQRKESRVKIAERRARIAVLEEERFKPIVAEWPHDCDGVEWSGPQAQAARAHEMAVREERRERESAEREARKALEKPVKRQRGEGAAGGVGYWTPEENQRFIEGIERYGWKDMVKIARHVISRTPYQVRSHMQKYLLRIAKDEDAAAEHAAALERAAAERERAVAEERARAAEELVIKRQINHRRRQYGEQLIRLALR